MYPTFVKTAREKKIEEDEGTEWLRRRESEKHDRDTRDDASSPVRDESDEDERAGPSLNENRRINSRARPQHVRERDTGG